MASEVRIDFVLDREVQKKLNRAFRRFPKAASRASQTAATYASRILVSAARQNIKSERTGLLKKSIGTKKLIYRNGGVVVIAVGPRSTISGQDKKGNKIWPIKYAHLVELGTKPHKIISGGFVMGGKWIPPGVVMDHPGAVPKPFMRPAYDNKKYAVKVRYQNKFLINLEKYMKKYGA